MNILVIGLGSMGKRRIRLIQEMHPDYTVYGVNGRPERRAEAEKQFDIRCFDAISSVDVKIDCAFVCTAPLAHAGIITECLSRNWHVFTELNLVEDGYERNMALAEEKGVKLFLSSTFFYREETKYIRSRISTENNWNYIYHIGQYLPDWHPWESYREMFLADKRTNGCREIFCIELPWLIAAFGEICEFHSVADKMTGLGIEYKDNFMIQFRHSNGNKGVLIVDVVSPCAVRKLEAYKENRYISWGGTPESIMEYNPETDELAKVMLQELTEHKDGYRAFITENAYKNEIQEFFNVVEGRKEPAYGFEQDLKILHLIDSIGA